LMQLFTACSCFSLFNTVDILALALPTNRETYCIVLHRTSRDKLFPQHNLIVSHVKIEGAALDLTNLSGISNSTDTEGMYLRCAR
jgi:hypothetical protein